MAIERWEMEQRKRGNTYGAEMARILRQQYGDVALPQPVIEQSSTKVKLKETPRSTEALEVTRFTPETRVELESRNYVIHELTGEWRKNLRFLGRSFWSRDLNPFSRYMAPRLSEVAINPDQIFLPYSNNKTLKQQQEMIDEFSDTLQINDAKAIIGKLPDYIELVLSHLKATGERLFGEKYGYNYTKTKTVIDWHVAVVGRFDTYGLDVEQHTPDHHFDNVFVSPLVVPTGNKQAAA